MTDESAAAPFLDDLRTAIDETMETKRDLIAGIMNALTGDVDDLLIELEDDLSGKYGSKAANTTDNEDEQEAAIIEVEVWVANNISNAGLPTRIAAYVWGVGEDAARSDLTGGTVLVP